MNICPADTTALIYELSPLIVRQEPTASITILLFYLLISVIITVIFICILSNMDKIIDTVCQIIKTTTLIFLYFLWTIIHRQAIKFKKDSFLYIFNFMLYNLLCNQCECFSCLYSKHLKIPLLYKCYNKESYFYGYKKSFIGYCQLVEKEQYEDKVS